MYSIVFLRHGRSLADDEAKCEGRYDSQLTQIGENQARETKAKFSKLGFKFTKIITSPLLRAFRTAEIINEEYEVMIEKEPLLMEIDNGIIAGLPKKELDSLYPLPSFISPYRYFPNNSGENVILVHSRAGAALNSIISRGPGNYLIVSHGGILNAIVRNILGIHYMVNGSGVVFKFEDNGFIQFYYDETKDLWIFVRMQ